MFVERYEIEASDAKQALKRAMIQNNMDGGYDAKTATEIATNELWTFTRATCSTGKAWTGGSESVFTHWTILKR